MMTPGKTLRLLLWCLALVCAAQSSGASEGARKYVMCGWDLKWINRTGTVPELNHSSRPLLSGC